MSLADSLSVARPLAVLAPSAASHEPGNHAVVPVALIDADEEGVAVRLTAQQVIQVRLWEDIVLGYDGTWAAVSESHASSQSSRLQPPRALAPAMGAGVDEAASMSPVLVARESTSSHRTGLKGAPLVDQHQVLRLWWTGSERRKGERISRLLRLRHPLSFRMSVIIPLKGRDAEGFYSQIASLFRPSAPLKNIVHRLIRVARCDRVFVERRAYSSRRRGGFIAEQGDRESTSVRLHFFRRSTQHDGASEYFGNVEVHPSAHHQADAGVTLGQVGRSLIVYPSSRSNECCDLVRVGSAIEDGDSSRSYYVVQRPFDASAVGKFFRIPAFPFEQQSIVDGSCGHAAVASCSRFLSVVYGGHPLSQSQVRDWSDLGPGSDLAERGAALALTRLGYRVGAYAEGGMTNLLAGIEGRVPVEGKESLFRLINFAVDSHLPPLISYRTGLRKRHTVLGVGHVTDSRRSIYSRTEVGAPALPKGRIADSTEWVASILVHDDARGPYLEFPLRYSFDPPSSDTVDEEHGDTVCGFSLSECLQTVLIPIPASVSLMPHIALQLAETVVRSYLAPEMSARILQAQPEGLTEYRRLAESFAQNRSSVTINTHLDLASRMRVALGRVYGVNLDAPHMNVLLPKYVYVSAIGYADELESGGASHDAEIYGLVLIDSTANEYTRDFVLYVQLGEYVEYFSSDRSVRSRQLLRLPRREITHKGLWARPIEV